MRRVARCGLLVAALAAATAHALAQPAPGSARSAPREAPTPKALLDRASEAGGWWMVARTSCDVGRSAPVLDRMNTVLSKLRPPRRVEDVVERVQDPHLTEPVRLKLEAEMTRVSALQTLAGDIRALEGDLAALAREKKALPERLDRPEWKLAEPLRSVAELEALRDRTDQSLAQACAASLEQIERLFIDGKTGVLSIAR